MTTVVEWFEHWAVDREVLSSVPVRCRITGIGHSCEASTKWVMEGQQPDQLLNPDMCNIKCEASPDTPKQQKQ